MSPKPKSESPSASENSYEKLIQFLKERGMDEDTAIEAIDLVNADPATDFYLTVVIAWRQIQNDIRAGSVNLDNKKTDALFTLVEKGDKIMKTFISMRGSVFPETKKPDKKEEEKPKGGALNG